AETVEISTAEWLLIERALNHLAGFIEAQAPVSEHISIIIQRRGVLWIYVQHSLELVLSLVELLLALVDCAEQEPRHFIFARITGNGFGLVGCVFGFLVAARAFIDLGDVQINVPIGGAILQASLKQLDRFIGLLILSKQQCVAGADGTVIGIF